MSKIESFQITLRRQNLKTSRNYTEAVSFSIVDDQFPPLISLYQDFSKPICHVNDCKLLPPVNPSKHICTFNISEPTRFVTSCKPDLILANLCILLMLLNFYVVLISIKFLITVNSNNSGRPINSTTLVHPVNFSNVVRPVDIRPVDSNKHLHPVSSSKPVCPVNSSKPVRPIDVCKSARPVSSNESVYHVDVCKSVAPVDVRKPICLVDIRKHFFIEFWRHTSLFLILLFFAVSVNTIAFNRTILYMILFVNVYMTYLIFTNFFFKCTFVISIVFLYILEIEYLNIYF